MAGPAQAGLFIYAKDLPRLTHFYQTLLSMQILHQREELVVLQSPQMQLLLHAIPANIAAGIDITSPPTRREDCALKFFFTVDSLAMARTTAAELGGEVFEQCWNGPGFRVSNACDPEGNIFHLREVTG